MSSRHSAMTPAGIVLSQPTMQTRPSNRWPRATSSIESVMTSRETSDAFIPSVPIDTPSETDTVLNSIGVPPAARMPALTRWASSRWLKLHGMVSIHVVATPMIGRARSSSVKPIAFSMARAGARSGPSVSAAEWRFAGSDGRSYGFSVTPASRARRGSPTPGPMRRARPGRQLPARRSCANRARRPCSPTPSAAAAAARRRPGGHPARARPRPPRRQGLLRIPSPSFCEPTTMANLIYSAIASLDGFTADQDGNFEWAAPDEDVHAFVNDLERPVGTYLYGRRMYETMTVWETMALDDEPPVMSDFAEIWRAADKVVYSRTLATASTARTRIERDFDPGAVREMKERAAADIGI